MYQFKKVRCHHNIRRLCDSRWRNEFSSTWIQRETISANWERDLEEKVPLIPGSTILSKHSRSWSRDEAHFTKDCSCLGLELYHKMKKMAHSDKIMRNLGCTYIYIYIYKPYPSTGVFPVNSSKSNTPKAYMSIFVLSLPGSQCSGAM